MLLKEAAEDTHGFDILLMTRYLTNEIKAESDALRHAGNNVEILLIPDILQEQQPPEGGESHV